MFIKFKKLVRIPERRRCSDWSTSGGTPVSVWCGMWLAPTAILTLVENIFLYRWINNNFIWRWPNAEWDMKKDPSKQFTKWKMSTIDCIASLGHNGCWCAVILHWSESKNDHKIQFFFCVILRLSEIYCSLIFENKLLRKYINSRTSSEKQNKNLIEKLRDIPISGIKTKTKTKHERENRRRKYVFPFDINTRNIRYEVKIQKHEIVFNQMRKRKRTKAGSLKSRPEQRKTTWILLNSNDYSLLIFVVNFSTPNVKVSLLS